MDNLLVLYCAVSTQSYNGIGRGLDLDFASFSWGIDCTCLLTFRVFGFVSVFLGFVYKREVAVLTEDLEFLISEIV